MGTKIKVLIACEFSGTVRDAFLARGHDAMSCDFRETTRPGPHYRGNVFDLSQVLFDLIIAHPPCKYLAGSGLHWNKRRPERAAQTEAALDFVRQIMRMKCRAMCIENPKSCIATRIMPATQIIQPHQFGHDASKTTCLWLKRLPMLQPTKIISPRFVRGLPRWGNQTDSGNNKLTRDQDRDVLRSITFEGVADAMVDQWGRLDLSHYRCDTKGW